MFMSTTVINCNITYFNIFISPYFKYLDHNKLLIKYLFLNLHIRKVN
jgi:hypothetical protein